MKLTYVYSILALPVAIAQFEGLDPDIHRVLRGGGIGHRAGKVMIEDRVNSKSRRLPPLTSTCNGLDGSQAIKPSDENWVISIDGAVTDWTKTNTVALDETHPLFIKIMTTAGNPLGGPGKEHLSNAYAHLDCSTGVLNLLVYSLSKPFAMTADMSRGNFWLKFGAENSQRQTTNNNMDFKFIPSPSNPSEYVGYEARYEVPVNTCLQDVEIHAQIEPGDTSSTGKGSGNSMPKFALDLSCACTQASDCASRTCADAVCNDKNACEYNEIPNCQCTSVEDCTGATECQVAECNTDNQCVYSEDTTSALCSNPEACTSESCVIDPSKDAMCSTASCDGDTCVKIEQLAETLCATIDPAPANDCQNDFMLCDGFGKCVESYKPYGTPCNSFSLDGTTYSADCVVGMCANVGDTSDMVCQPVPKPQGSSCNVDQLCGPDGLFCNEPTSRGDCHQGDQCTDGYCNTQVYFTAQDDIVCRESEGCCDPHEICQGDLSCPANDFFDTSVVCRQGCDNCDDPEETCPGNSADCSPNIIFEGELCIMAGQNTPVGTLYMSADENEFCYSAALVPGSTFVEFHAEMVLTNAASAPIGSAPGQYSFKTTDPTATLSACKPISDLICASSTETNTLFFAFHFAMANGETAWAVKCPASAEPEPLVSSRFVSKSGKAFTGWGQYHAWKPCCYENEEGCSDDCAAPEPAPAPAPTPPTPTAPTAPTAPTPPTPTAPTAPTAPTPPTPTAPTAPTAPTPSTTCSWSCNDSASQQCATGEVAACVSSSGLSGGTKKNTKKNKKGKKGNKSN